MYSSCWKVPIWCICCWILCTKGFQDLANEDNILLKVYPCPIPLFTIFIQYTSSLLKADFSTLKNFCQVIWLWQTEVSWSEKVFLSNSQNSWYQPSLKGGNSWILLVWKKTRALASVRIHVERVIGLLYCKYTILQSTLPTNFLNNDNAQDEVPIIDRIIKVCSALVNLCPPIVPFD